MVTIRGDTLPTPSIGEPTPRRGEEPIPPNDRDLPLTYGLPIGPSALLLTLIAYECRSRKV